MFHIPFEESAAYKVAILVKPNALKRQQLEEAYVEPLVQMGLRKSDMIAFSMEYNAAGKSPAGLVKTYLEDLLPTLKEIGTKYIYVTDAAYFKVLTKQTKAEPHLGYVLPCAIKGFEDLNVVLGVSYQVLIYKPESQEKIDLSLKALADHVNEEYVAIGSDIVHSEHYPEDLEGIRNALNQLHQYPELSADIEAFSLKFYEAGIATIGFAPNKHEGIAFACDYKPLAVLADGLHGIQQANPEVRALIKEFLENYKGSLIWHNSAYDLKVLIYTLWMKDPLDTEGLLEGLEVMTRLFHDTKIIAYLALNSTARNSYGLKDLAHEFAGNWAQEDIKDVRKIPLNKLLRYNLVDCLSTNYVKEKYWDRMINDEQLEIYETLMVPSLKVIIQMELTGLPMNLDTVQVKKQEMEAKAQSCMDVVNSHPLIKELNYYIKEQAMLKKQATLKKKILTIEDFEGMDFNPNSPKQMQALLYEFMALPVLDYTDTKQPATGEDTLKKLMHHTNDQSYKDLIVALMELGKVSKILGTFIPAFEQSHLKPDNWHYLHGSFILGGTVSGRLSSREPKFGLQWGNSLSKVA